MSGVGQRRSRRALRVGLLAAGDKGFHLAADISRDVRITHIVTYAQPASSFAVKDFARIAEQVGASLLVGHRPELDFALETDVVFAVGWQYLLPQPPPNLVILHDSLLPRHRGFAPTVNALLAGETTLGVTALLPGRGVDDGPILAQCSAAFTAPVRLGAALEGLRDCYISVVRQVCEALAQGRSLAALGRPQAEVEATYSQWRDDFDYLVDWCLDAPSVVRHILAVGAPYSGAIAFTAGGQKLFLDEAVVGDDVNFVNRTAGKVHALAAGHMDVVCGKGLARITRWRADSGWSPKLRTRFVERSVATLLLLQERSAAST
jgi:methionyl-tRNA formyltransferase